MPILMLCADRFSGRPKGLSVKTYQSQKSAILTWLVFQNMNFDYAYAHDANAK